jgi:hypothetical protein
MNLKNLKEDLQTCVKAQYHISVHDLLSMLLIEEIPELIKFVERVNNTFEKDLGDVTGDYMKGYKDGVAQVKREIYNAKI